MRVAVLDVGSNSANLLIADVGGGVPLPVHAVRQRLCLAERVAPQGHLDANAITAVVDAVSRATEHARRWRVEETFAYGTAVIRDAPNRDEILAAVAGRSGLRLGLLPGEVEAELTFLAVRRWFGWRAGPVLLLDIGGGSAEIACGRGAVPDYAVSLPLGAGRLTREMLPGDPPGQQSVRRLRRHVRQQLREVAERVGWEGPRTAVATSKTFTQLARLCGAAPGTAGPFVVRTLRRDRLAEQIDRLSVLPAARRAELPGISRHRARQSLAGAVVALASMELLGLDEVQICPWALREGILIRHTENGTRWWPATAGLTTTSHSAERSVVRAVPG